VYGQSIQEVAVTLNQILKGKTAYSDGWEVDRPWLSSLFWKAKTLMQFRFSKIKMIMTSRQMRRWHYMKDEILRKRMATDITPALSSCDTENLHALQGLTRSLVPPQTRNATIPHASAKQLCHLTSST
jgi:hypothetical protein